MAMSGMSVTMWGRLTRDPDINTFTREDGSEGCYAKFSIAVDRPYKANRRENEPTADFFNVEASGAAANFVRNYMRKGSLIITTGYFTNEPYVDNQGVNRNSFVLKTSSVQSLEKKNDNGGGQPGGGGSYQNSGGQSYQQRSGQPNGGGQNYQQRSGQPNGGSQNYQQRSGQPGGGSYQNSGGGQSYQQQRDGGQPNGGSQNYQQRSGQPGGGGSYQNSGGQSYQQSSGQPADNQNYQNANQQNRQNQQGDGGYQNGTASGYEAAGGGYYQNGGGYPPTDQGASGDGFADIPDGFRQMNSDDFYGLFAEENGGAPAGAPDGY